MSMPWPIARCVWRMARRIWRVVRRIWCVARRMLVFSKLRWRLVAMAGGVRGDVGTVVVWYLLGVSLRDAIERLPLTLLSDFVLPSLCPSLFLSSGHTPFCLP